jgi:hypothetical protein
MACSRERTAFGRDLDDLLIGLYRKLKELEVTNCVTSELFLAF